MAALRGVGPAKNIDLGNGSRVNIVLTAGIYQEVRFTRLKLAQFKGWPAIILKSKHQYSTTRWDIFGLATGRQKKKPLRRGAMNIKQG